MTRFAICWMTLSVAICACDVDDAPTTSTTAQPGMRMQGTTLQGMTLDGTALDGTALQDMTMLGFRVDGATIAGAALHNVRVERGELVAERGSTTLRGTALAGTHLFALVRNIAVAPPTSAAVEYRITAIAPEASENDPTHTGHTFLYTLERRIGDTQSWKLGCPTDGDNSNVAIPLPAIWDEHGDRSVSSSLFTFGCTTGVIAKCYRWGYRPWVTGFGDLTSVHQTCTRLARADYCGVGRPHTRAGTSINVWDNLPSPGPIQAHNGPLGLPVPPPGMLFEAGWNTDGAVCLSHSRWILQDGLGIAALCPDRLVPPGLLGETVCDTVSQVLGQDSGARMFNEAILIMIP